MNTEQLRYFVSVARYRNFTETAREFYVTQPAVTHQISALEREVGARLFLRTTRNVSLTRAGELFLEDAKRILDQEERALGRLRQLESSGCWELRIGYLNSPSRHFLPRLIAAYREAYPQVRVELIRRDATGIQAGIDAAAYDVSFSVLSDLKGMNGYACRKLGADFYCLVCPREHPCLDNAVIDYAKLATEPFACLSHTGGAYPDLPGTGFHPGVGHRVSRPGGCDLCRGVRTGNCHSPFPDSGVHAYHRPGLCPAGGAWADHRAGGGVAGAQ